MVAALRVLGRARLARDVHGEAAERRGRRTEFRDIVQSFLHELDDIFRHFERREQFWLKVLDDFAVLRLDAAHDMGPKALAIRRNLAHDHGRLQRRHEVEALADGGVKRLGEVPLAIVEVLLLVAAVCDEAVRLIWQVDTRARAEAKHARVFFEVVDAEAVAHFIEIDVVGMRERFLEVDPAERLALGIALRDDPVMARIENLFFRRDLALRQRRRARDDLERRARRILARDGLVVHRVERVVVEHSPVL